MKSVEIRSYFWSLFSPNRWEHGPEITPYLNTFHAANYRPISILSNFSKLIEKWIYTQINSFPEPKTWKYLPGFCKNDNTQHALLKMTETWRPMLNTDNKVGAVVMDLLNVFATLNHNLILYKLNVYGFDIKALTFIERFF